MLIRVTKRLTKNGFIKEHVTTVKNEKHLRNYINHLDDVSKIWKEFELVKCEIIEH